MSDAVDRTIWHPTSCIRLHPFIPSALIEQHDIRRPLGERPMISRLPSAPMSRRADACRSRAARAGGLRHRAESRTRRPPLEPTMSARPTCAPPARSGARLGHTSGNPAEVLVAPDTLAARRYQPPLYRRRHPDNYRTGGCQRQDVAALPGDPIEQESVTPTPANYVVKISRVATRHRCATAGAAPSISVNPHGIGTRTVALVRVESIAPHARPAVTCLDGIDGR